MRQTLRRSISQAVLIVLVAGPLVGTARAASGPEWIWSPAHTKTEAPAGDCYFRKTFNSTVCEEAEIQIAADDEYELYVNGRLVGKGDNWRALTSYDITRRIVSGPNTIAVKVTNREAGSAGLVARVLVKPQGGTFVAHSTDSSWRTTIKKYSRWTMPTTGDVDWVNAQSYGKLGMTLPWGNEVQRPDGRGRFQVTREFRIRWTAKPDQTGSLIAMTFNERGEIIASRENGGLIRLADADRDGTFESVTPYCDLVKNCQGLLALNGSLFVIGDGSQGNALYRLDDTDGDQVADKAEALVRFKGKPSEHGAHALVLGPDGMLYITVGNHSAANVEPSETSPYRFPYEGDLLQPRYEDPGGHAVGVKAPGGTILRTDVEGTAVEIVAGGLRNCYDLAFNREGELFTYDSDMEWNVGLPWYRPTRVLHVTAGAEFGWRSGWAKWPGYFHDGLPMAAELGRGSPTGIVAYNHVKYPSRYHNALFCCDWAQGQIKVVRLKADGATYAGEPEVFVQGRPLNVTDLEVGPDGWLYFCTGGRNTEGGIYCVTWAGQVPSNVTDLGTGVERAIRQPQIQSAWARQQIALVHHQQGDDWGPQLTAIARNARRTTQHRMRALDLMQLFGPFPSPALLIELSADGNVALRTKCAALMGLHQSTQTAARLQQLLGDRSAAVRRQACESLARSGSDVPLETVLRMLGDKDRHVAFAARRLLECRPVGDWREKVLTDARFAVFLQGSTSLLAAAPDADSGLAILGRANDVIAGKVQIGTAPVGFVSDKDFTNLLRLVQLTLERCQLDRDDMPELVRRLAAEYPSRDAIINRELIRLLAYLNEPSVTARLIEALQSDIAAIEKMHIAAHAPFIREGWTISDKVELLRFYEQARLSEGGAGLTPNVDNIARDFFKNLTDAERKLVLSRATQWPSSAFAVLAGMSRESAEQLLEVIIQVDRQMASIEGDAAEKFRLAVIAVLGRSRTPAAMAHLREVYEREPEQRVMVAVGLAQVPEGDNWPLLVRTISVAEGGPAQLLLAKLAQVDRRPDDPEVLRQVIISGLREPEKLAGLAHALLVHWTGAMIDAQPGEGLAAWQTWFAEEYPEMPAAALPQISQQDRWTYDELLSFLNSEDGQRGIAARGSAVFGKASCAKCHRHGNRGANVGPDLTTVSQRFQQKEILEAIIYPSHVVSDRYATHSLTTNDGISYSGIVSPVGETHVALVDSKGKRTVFARDDIEAMAPSKVSTMPAGLLNQLTLEEVADLFAFLGKPARTDVSSRRPGSTR